MAPCINLLPPLLKVGVIVNLFQKGNADSESVNHFRRLNAAKFNSMTLQTYLSKDGCSKANTFSSRITQQLVFVVYGDEHFFRNLVV
jgi:hypothetical protein